MDIYAIGAYECIHVNTCERVLPGPQCISVFQWKWESQSLASAELNEAEWNMCFARNGIESNGPLIALPPPSPYI